MDFSFSGEREAVAVEKNTGYPVKMRKALEEIAVFWASFFYTGKSPKAPGTVGSLAALPLAWGAWAMGPVFGWSATLFIFISGTLAAKVIIKRTGETDHQSIVIDEVVGILITTSVASNLWWHYLLAFLFFRLFDITKPWPVSWVDQKWKSALGTMMDDTLAALLAAAALWLALHAHEWSPVLHFQGN